VLSRAGRLLLEFDQGEQAGRGRVAGPDHHRAPAGIAVAAIDVGQAVGDPRSGVGLAEGWEPRGAERVGLGPGSGGVDHRPCLEIAELAVGVADADQEGHTPNGTAARRTERNRKSRHKPCANSSTVNIVCRHGRTVTPGRRRNQTSPCPWRLATRR
jgi:hypothetical protein